MFGMLLIAMLDVAQGQATTDLSQPPKLLNPEAVITYNDYPAEALRRGEYGIDSILVHVSAHGQVISCDITESSGSAMLDATTCALIKKRARFEAAKDAAGSPIEGDYRMANIWGADEHQPRATIYVPLQVSAIPANYRSPVRARLLFDATGHVSACEVTTTSGSGAADRAACAYIKQKIVMAPPKSAASNIAPVAVRYLTASLSTQAEEPSANK